MISKTIMRSDTAGLLAYISDQEDIIQAQSKLIQKLTVQLALHEALEAGNEDRKAERRRSIF